MVAGQLEPKLGAVAGEFAATLLAWDGHGVDHAGSLTRPDR